MAIDVSSLNESINPSVELNSPSPGEQAVENERAEKEEEQLDTEKDLYYKNQERDLKIKALRQELKLKRKFSRQVIKYLWIFSGCCLGILFLQGFSPKICIKFTVCSYFYGLFRLNGFHLDGTPLTTLIGSTAASAIGLVAIVLRGLFPSKALDDKKLTETDDKKSAGKDDTAKSVI